MPLIGPKKKPQDFGFKAGDSHLIVNDQNETIKGFSFNGELLWVLPALARGLFGETEYRRRNSDTPPGLYKIGQVFRDYEDASVPIDTKIKYGWYYFDLEDLEGQEGGIGRAGIAIHGGGSANGWPGAWEPIQPLRVTQGCVRMHNTHLRKYILPLVDSGTVYVSVYQEG